MTWAGQKGLCNGSHLPLVRPPGVIADAGSVPASRTPRCEPSRASAITTHDLRDDVPRLVKQPRGVADTHILAADLVLVVQRHAGMVEPATLTGSKTGERG